VTHADLVSRGTRWLRLTAGCGVVLSRGSVCVSEQPDAVGWKGNGMSILLEAKASRADFFRDAEKECRQLASIDPATGIGNERYFLTRPALVSFSEIPAGWGLLEAFDGRIRVRLSAPWHAEKNVIAELALLLAVLRRGPMETDIVLQPKCLPDVGL
jgi:hypothetical protein